MLFNKSLVNQSAMNATRVVIVMLAKVVTEVLRHAHKERIIRCRDKVTKAHVWNVPLVPLAQIMVLQCVRDVQLVRLEIH